MQAPLALVREGGRAVFFRNAIKQLPLAFIGAGVAILVAATLAAYSPARRATRVNPTVALRYE